MIHYIYMNCYQVQFHVISLLLPEKEWLAAKTGISALSTAIPLSTIPAVEYAVEVPAVEYAVEIPAVEYAA